MKISHNSKLTNRVVAILLTIYVLFSGAGSSRADVGKPSVDKSSNPSAHAKKKILYWVAPMDPNYRRDKPGKSPMGMDLIPVYDDDDNGGKSKGNAKEPIVGLTQGMIDRLSVRVADVNVGDLPRRIDTVGYVDYDESHISQVTTRADGWVKHLAVNSIGERVNKGQVLFSVFAPTLVNAQEEYRQSLLSGNKSLMRASRERLLALGISNDQIVKLEKTRRVQQWIDIRSPQNGIVTTLNIREGSYIKPSTVAMGLADLSSIWVVAEVFERQADWVQLGNKAVMKLTYLPGRSWEGRVAYIYPAVDPKTRTLQVRLQFDNPGELIKPNMYAKVTILASPKHDALSIPLEALIRTGTGDHVIMYLGAGRFAPRNVTEGIESGDRVEILDGLKAGDRVVNSAQFLIDSEASFKASMLRITKSAPDSQMTGSIDSKSVFSVYGKITNVNLVQHSLTISHGPVPALKWPAMTMSFKVGEGITLAGIKVGDRVNFSFVPNGDNYTITQIASATMQEAMP